MAAGKREMGESGPVWGGEGTEHEGKFGFWDRNQNGT